MRLLGVQYSWFKLLVPVICVGFLGCGGAEEDVPELVPATGIVTYKSEPLAGAAVNFVPRDGTPGTGAYGVTDAAGKFTLKHRSEAEGIEPGTYTVAVTKMTMPDGGPIPDGQDAADVGAIQIIPPKYSEASNEMNPNIVTIPASGGEFPIDLK